MMQICLLFGAGLGAVSGLGVCWIAGKRIVGFEKTARFVALLGATMLGVVIAAGMALVAQHITHQTLRWPAVIATGLILAWIGGDLLHAFLMRPCYAAWDATISRDEDGVREGCREFTMGEGICAILLVHGFADSPNVFQRFGPALADKGYLCRAVRLPFFAMPIKHQHRSNAELWRRTLDEEIRSLKETHDRVIVVAHSLGAAIALDYMLDHPNAAEGLVMLAPLIEVSGRLSPLFSPQTWYRILDSTLIFTDRIHTLFRARLRDAASTPLMREDLYVARKALRAIFALLRKGRKRRNAFGQPLMMVLAHRDKVVDNAAAESLFKQCASADKRMMVIENTSHVLPLDNGWKEIVDAIGEFEQRLSKKRATTVRERARDPLPSGRSS